MTTPDPQALYAACLRLERATGRTILREISVNYLARNGVEEYYCEGLLLSRSAAADILEARLWRAVREAHASIGWYVSWDKDGVYSQRRMKAPAHTTEYEYPTLTSAADAISEFVETNRTTPPAL